METSENTEAGIVLVSTVTAAVSGFVAAAPLPFEWKAPIEALTLAITGAVLAFWKTKVNVKA